MNRKGAKIAKSITETSQGVNAKSRKNIAIMDLALRITLRGHHDTQCAIGIAIADPGGAQTDPGHPAAVDESFTT